MPGPHEDRNTSRRHRLAGTWWRHALLLPLLLPILDAPLPADSVAEAPPPPCVANPVDAPSPEVAAVLDPDVFRHFRSRDMVLVTGSDPGNAAYLHPLAVEPFIEMRDAAIAEGLEVQISSGWRSWDRQMKAYRIFRRTGRNLSGHVVPNIAHPSVSRHPPGLAVDLEVGENVALGEWLVANAPCFGFTNTRGDEPWEWQYTGTVAPSPLGAPAGAPLLR